MRSVFKAEITLRLAAVLACLTVAGLLAGERPDFSGIWKLENSATTLHIEHHDPQFILETSMKGKDAVQRYTTDGKESISTGIDGDEFHTRITWQADELVFAIEEHERGKVLKSTERWKLIENGTKLHRDRVTEKFPQGRTLIYTK